MGEINLEKAEAFSAELIADPSFGNITDRIKNFRSKMLEKFQHGNEYLYYLEALFRQFQEINESTRNNVFKSLATSFKYSKNIIGKLREKNETLDEITSSKVHLMTRDEEISQLVGDKMLKSLIANWSDIEKPTEEKELPLLDEQSKQNIFEAFRQIHNGKKVAFTANHLSELDPSIFSLILRNIDWNKYAEDEDRKYNWNWIADKVYVLIGGVVREKPFKDYWASNVNRGYVFSNKHISQKQSEIAKNFFNNEEIEDESTQKLIQEIAQNFHQIKDNGLSVLGEKINNLNLHPSDIENLLMWGELLAERWENIGNKMKFFSGKTLINMKNEMGRDKDISLFLHPGGKRSRPRIDGKHIEDAWQPEESLTLMKRLGLEMIVPVGVIGTNNIHGPLGKGSSSDLPYVSHARCFYRVGPVVGLSDWGDVNEDNYRDLFKNIDYSKITSEQLRSIFENATDEIITDNFLRNVVFALNGSEELPNYYKRDATKIFLGLGSANTPEEIVSYTLKLIKDREERFKQLKKWINWDKVGAENIEKTHRETKIIVNKMESDLSMKKAEETDFKGNRLKRSLK